MAQIAGYNIYEDINMVEQRGYKKVKKTLRERITWKFWESHKEVPNIVPRKDILIMESTRSIFCHPEMRREIFEYIGRNI